MYYKKEYMHVYYSLIIFMNFSTVSHGNLAHLDHVQTNIDTIPIRHIIELIPELTVLFTHIHPHNYNPPFFF